MSYRITRPMVDNLADMDPNATLAELRELIAAAAVATVDVDAIAERFDALDAWLTRGGFLPADWAAGR